MRMLIKTRKERLVGSRKQSKVDSKDFESDNSIGRRKTLSGSSMLDEQSEPLPSEVLQANDDKSFVSMLTEQNLLNYLDLLFSQVPEQISPCAIQKW